MKKLSPKQKSHFLRLNRKRLRRAHYKKWKKRFSNIAQNTRFKAPSPAIIVERDHYSIQAPKEFSIKNNYKEVMGFIEKFRSIAYASERPIELSGRKLTLDLAPVEHLAPAGALLLAAEIDRWRRVVDFQPTTHRFQDWDERVKLMLLDIGFFELLQVNPPAIKRSTQTSDDATRMIKLTTGTTAPGENCREIQRALGRITGGQVPDPTYMYDGISEAMTNVCHHAYPPTSSRRYHRVNERRWWASGSYNSSTNMMKTLILDFGVGIPDTLPRCNRWEEIRRKIPGKHLLFADHAQLIKAAISTYRTRTATINRGKGLVQMSEYVDQSANGYMKILSGMGEVVYRNNSRYQLQRLPVIFDGTLVEWRVENA